MLASSQACGQCLAACREVSAGLEWHAEPASSAIGIPFCARALLTHLLPNLRWVHCIVLCVADEIKLGGASAGSLLAACIKADMPLDGLVESNMRLMSDLRQGGTRGRLGVRACRPHPPLGPAC